jgi:hypothetical protein
VTSDKDTATFTAEIETIDVPLPEFLRELAGGLQCIRARVPILRPRGDLIGKPNIVVARDPLPSEALKKSKKAAVDTDSICDILNYVGASPCMSVFKTATADAAKAAALSVASGSAEVMKDKASVKHLLK